MLHDDDNDADNVDDEQCLQTNRTWKNHGKFVENSRKVMEKSLKFYGNFHGIYGNSMENSRKFH